MPRQGLTNARVSAAAAELADSVGLSRLTVAAVARHFGVSDAALYVHVRSRDALIEHVAVRAAAAFADALAIAVAGRAGHQALVGFADAWRAFAVTHPGQYAATQLQLPPEVGTGFDGAPPPDRAELRDAARVRARRAGPDRRACDSSAAPSTAS